MTEVALLLAVANRHAVRGSRHRRGTQFAARLGCGRPSATRLAEPVRFPAQLRLAEAVDQAMRKGGPNAVVDLLVSTLTRSRFLSDELDEHLETLRYVCRQTRRYGDAIAVFEHVAALHPDRQHEMAVEIALAHAHGRRADEAVAVLRTACRQHKRLPASQRSVAFLQRAEIAATVLRDSETARDIATMLRSGY